MAKKSWNQHLVVFALSMVVVMMSMTTKPASAEPGEVKTYKKICKTNGVPILGAGDWFGTSVADIGDLDGDGVKDIAAGAEYDDDGDGNDSGAMYVMFMNTNGTVKSYHKISEDSGDGLTLGPVDRFGESVAGIGDLDGDGIEDIAAGAFLDDDGGVNAGAVYVFFMNIDGTVDTIHKISEDSGDGLSFSAGDHFGCSVAGIGDLDGDGIEDIAVGAYGGDDGGEKAGEMYVLFLNTNGTVKSYQKISKASGGGPTNLAAGDRFGWSVAQIGDLDGDGVKDLVAGANYDDDGAELAGAVYVLFMNTNGTVKSNQKISQLVGGGPPLDGTNHFGRSVAGIGDLDADRVRDIAVGACGDDDGATDAGALYVLFMNTNGTVKSYQKISKTSGNGPDILGGGDYFGCSVAAIGDLNGDGMEDIAVGAICDDDGGTDVGAVYTLMLEPLPAFTIFYAY